MITSACLAAKGGDHAHSVEGVVKDAATGEALAGATVLLHPSKEGRVTDNEGQFRFGVLPAGRYVLHIHSLGYLHDSAVVEVVPMQTAVFTIQLKPSQLLLSQVQIVASAQNEFSLISQADLGMRTVLSSQELLRMVPGLFIGQHAGGGKAEQLFLRGYDLDHGTDIALSVDGMPVNMVSHAHGQGYADLHFLIPELVDDIQFGLGPYQSDKGNFATAGYVGFQTKNNLNGNLVKTEWGSYGLIRNLAMIDLSPHSQDKKANAYFAAEQLYSRGYFESAQDLQRLNLFSKYSRRIGEPHQLSISASYFKSGWDASGQIPQRAIDAGFITRFGAIDDREGGATERANLNIELKTLTHRGNLIRNQVYFTRYLFDLYSNFTFFLNDSTNGDQIRQKENRNLAGYQGSYATQLNVLGRTMRLRTGMSLRTDFINGIELSHTRARTRTLESIQRGDVRELNGGAFADAEWPLTSRLLLSAGARADQFLFFYQNHLPESSSAPDAQMKSAAATVNVQAQAHYMVNSATRIYLKAGSGFHSNDARVVVDPVAQSALPRVWSADAGAMLKPSAGLLVHTGLWASMSQSEFVYVGDEGIVEPAGRSRRLGADLSARWQPATWIYADADVNFTLPRLLDVPATENRIPLAPTFSSTGGLTFTPTGPLKGSLRYRWLGQRPADEAYALAASGYFLLDAQAAYRYRFFEFSLAVTNLLNQEWNETQFATTSRLKGESNAVTEIHFTPGSPRALRGGLTLRF